MNKDQILTFLLENKEHFLQRYHIDKIALFGSFARGENTSGSDVDIIYTLSDGHKISFDEFIAFENELEKAFLTKIDIVNEKKLNPIVKMKARGDFIYV